MPPSVLILATSLCSTVVTCTLPALLNTLTGVYETATCTLPALLNPLNGLCETATCTLLALLNPLTGLCETATCTLPEVLNPLNGLCETANCVPPSVLIPATGLCSTPPPGWHYIGCFGAPTHNGPFPPSAGPPGPPPPHGDPGPLVHRADSILKRGPPGPPPAHHGDAVFSDPNNDPETCAGHCGGNAFFYLVGP